MTQTDRPEIGSAVDAGGVKINYLPALAENFHVIAPDMVGFGFTERPGDITYGVQTWADQVVGLLDELSYADWRVELLGLASIET
jgi:pimeloyl-ACP methyl ester carboxylesterase